MLAAEGIDHEPHGRNFQWPADSIDTFHSILCHFAIIHGFLYSVNTPWTEAGRDTIDLSLDTTVHPVEIPAVHSFSSYVHRVSDS